MLSSLKFLLFFSLIFAFANVSLAAEEEEKKMSVRLGYILKDIPYVVKRDLQLGFDFVTDRFAKKYNVEVTLHIDEDEKKLITMFEEEKLEYLGLRMCTLAKYYDLLSSSMGYTYLSSTNENLQERYVMLATSESAEAKSYLGKKVVMQEDECNAIMYADMTSIKYFNVRYFETLDVEYVQNPNRAILKRFFKQADIAFVPEKSWELAKSMNPAMENNVKLVETSPAIFTYGIETYHKNLPASEVAVIKQSDKDLQDTEDGKQLLTIMKIGMRSQVQPQELRAYIKPYLEYQKEIKHFAEQAQ
ncbi:MAG: hypothetical protein PHU40_10865 [Sulfurimonas sp.]|nr:hypothetical protein [Sulfurimonas sp.]